MHSGIANPNEIATFTRKFRQAVKLSEFIQLQQDMCLTVMFPLEVSCWSSGENLTLKENFQNIGNLNYCYFAIYRFYPYFPLFVYMCCQPEVFSKNKKPLGSEKSALRFPAICIANMARNCQYMGNWEMRENPTIKHEIYVKEK